MCGSAGHCDYHNGGHHGHDGRRTDPSVHRRQLPARRESQSIKREESLLEAGLIDSTGVLDLVGFIENEFAIPVADAEIEPRNLDSIATITDYVAGKQAATTRLKAA